MSTSGWSDYETASMVGGTNGVWPWGKRTAIDSNATWIWTSKAYDDNNVYFSAAITATDVPEPSTLAIFALGLMGLVSRRFKKQA